MARSHREIFSFVVGFIVLYIGGVISTNCDTSHVSPVVPFCSSESASGRQVFLSGIDNRTNGIGCNCYLSLTSYNQDPVTIEIKNVTPTSNLCDYSLYSVYQTTNEKLYSCVENVNKAGIENVNKAGIENVNKAGISMDTTKTVRLHMETGTDNGVGFPFCLKLRSGQGSRISLYCTSNSTTTTTASLTVMESTNTNDFMSTVYNNNNIPTSSKDGRLIGTVIGSIVGVLVVVALVIVIVCLVNRRRKKPLELQDKPHNYVNAVATSNNANGQNNQNTQVGNQEMIYLENDLYNSIDDDEPDGRKGGNHEGMLYLENDLYISSTKTDDVSQDAETSVPHQPVEYAVVNKPAKKISSGNGASMGHTVGPHGDEYTLVQKKLIK